MKALEQRITGTEMEYSVWIRRSEDDKLATIEDDRIIDTILNTHLPNDIKRIPNNGMTSNGSRIYRDLSRFIEYATPEDTSFKSTVANEIAGERVVLGALDNAVNAGVIYDYSLNKRVLSDNGNTWGYHTSFSIDDKIDLNLPDLRVIGMHLATQNIYAGSGALYFDKNNRVKGYSIAQKVLNLNCEISSATHGTEQPLLSSRNEPHADNRTSRLHLTTMDANISPWATWMRLGTTSIVARLMENGYIGPAANDLDLVDMPMYQYAKHIAKNPTLNYSVRGTKHGRQLRALDVQRTLYEHALKLDLPDQEQEVIVEWQRALDDLEKDPALLSDRADWVIRKQAIERAIAKRGVSLSSNVAITIDKSYDSIDSKSTNGPDSSPSLGMKLRGRGVLRQWMNEQAITAAIEHPPQTTRAKARGDFIKQHWDQPTVAANWNYVSHNMQAGPTFRLDDPLETELPPANYPPKYF